jgi:hypothetical protein
MEVIMAVTLDDLPTKHHEAWTESVNAARGVSRGEIHAIGVRISELEYITRMDDSQPLMFKPAKTFASFETYLINPKLMFCGKLLNQEMVDNTLQKIMENNAPASVSKLFHCVTRLNRDAQDICNYINRCKQG